MTSRLTQGEVTGDAVGKGGMQRMRCWRCRYGKWRYEGVVRYQGGEREGSEGRIVHYEVEWCCDWVWIVWLGVKEGENARTLGRRNHDKRGTRRIHTSV